MDGFSKRTEKKRKAIEEAALTRLMEEGSESMRIEDIARTAEVSQVTIYNYYGSKQGLLNEVMKRYLQDVQTEFEETVYNQSISFPEKLKFLLLMKKKGSKLLDLQVLQSLLAENGDLRKYVEDYYQKVSMPVFMAFLDQGREEGYLKENISMESIIVYYQLLKTAIEKHYEMFTGENGEQLVEEITQIFFYGLLKEDKQL